MQRCDQREQVLLGCPKMRIKTASQSAFTDVQFQNDFYPVLMSTHGYADLIGFKARRAGRVGGT